MARPGSFRANPDNLYLELSRVYWDALRREVANMILCLVALTKRFPEATHFEEDLPDLEMDNFGKIFRLWSAFSILERLVYG